MAAGSELLDDVFFSAEVDETAVSAVVGSLESQLIGPGVGKLAGRLQTPGGQRRAAAGDNSAQTRDNNNTGPGQESARPGQESAGAGARVPAGARLQSIGAGTPGHLKQGLGPAPTLNHTPVSGQRAAPTVAPIGAPTGATLNGSNMVMVVNSHDSAAFSNTSSSPAPVPPTPGAAVNNGPGCVLKAPPPPSGTVIQTSLMNTSTVISAQTPGLTTRPTVALVRPPMQTQVTVAPPNGAAVNAVHLPTTITVAQSHRVDSPKALQTVAQAPTTVVQPIRGPIMQTGGRTTVPGAVAAGAGAIRAIAPQVLAPRVPPPQQNQPSVHNIQLPPGMVLVRSESGQLLMIHQQTLAQMQAQTQGAMAPRPTTPTSTPPVHITSVQAPGTPLITRPVAPTTIIKQSSPVPAGVQPTTALQRPPILQNTIMLGGTPAPPVGTPPPGQVGVAAAQRVTPAGPTPTGPPPPTAVTPETLENVKKCKNFLSTLIKLASSGKQSSETAANVKELVKNLLEGKLEAEDFTSRLYRELNSSPQPYLVPFLKRSLPALRQLTPDSVLFIQQSQLPLGTPPAATPPSPALTSAVLAGSTPITQRSIAPPTATPTATTKTTSITSTTSSTLTTPTTSAHQPIASLPQHTHSKPNLVVQQQGALVRGPQVTPMITLRPGQPRMFTPVVRTQTQTLPSGCMMKTAVSVGSKVLSVPGSQSLPSALQKAKLKDAGGATFRDDDDINDVASMAGVNLSEESDRILATNSELVGAVTRSCKDEAFLYTGALHSRILQIGKKFGISELGSDVVSIVSHAAQQRLQNLLEKVTQVAQQRNVPYKEDERHEQVSDVRAQLKFFEQLDQMEKQRKEEQEREILMKAAKSRSRQEDPEQLRLKQKAKEMQQQELAQMRQRDANLTALAAIGPRKKRKVDSPASGSGPEGVCSAGSGGLCSVGSGGSRQFSRQRITRVNLRDLLFCLENERDTSRSHLLYKAFLK
ncbi:transcription initiation factor TFIID subunit 4 [Astyanax mexicanus]|uniref:Transcription initiation factor TFIID subunit 4 n=1 Tax=Astyanax mexicanus TaxID=7994 RepID=A0A8T2LEL1_ASTMX|nr:transcription initiation factor TFIID subunit 4 [Astyanax mexicanus]